MCLSLATWSDNSVISISVCEWNKSDLVGSHNCLRWTYAHYTLLKQGQNFSQELDCFKMIDSACDCQNGDKKSPTAPRVPTLDKDLHVRRFQRQDTRRIHNLFLEETRCLLWPMFLQAVRSPSAVILHVVLMAAGVILARSCIFALFGVMVAASGIFVYIYRWFYLYLTSSLKGDLANITQVRYFCWWL